MIFFAPPCHVAGYECELMIAPGFGLLMLLIAGAALGVWLVWRGVRRLLRG